MFWISEHSYVSAVKIRIRIILSIMIIEQVKIVFKFKVFIFKADICRKVMKMYRNIVLEMSLDSQTWYVLFNSM